MEEFHQIELNLLVCLSAPFLMHFEVEKYSHQSCRIKYGSTLIGAG